ncbi:MAG TPA: hypothetical protein VFR94_25405 [Nitrososphaeraceae archaeon]|nr:hypothetical protein [Nitrososphaeraceae archaeon]
MMNTIVTISSIILATMILLFFSPLSSTHHYTSNIRLNTAEGQLPNCPVGYQRSPLGFCEPTSVTNFQNCPVGYQVNVNGICVPATGSQLVNPANQLVGQPQATFAQPQSSELTSSLISPTLINPPAGQLSPWFPSLPAIACGGTSTMTTIGSLEGDSSNDDNNKNGNNNNKDNGNKDNDDDDDDKKEYAFQIESEGGPSADPESVDGTVFVGEKNIERNNGKDFDIKDVFNDCQVSMFDD